MVRLRSSTRYAAIKTLIAAFRASHEPLRGARAASTLAHRISSRNDDRRRCTHNTLHPLQRSLSLTRALHTVKSGQSSRPVENVAILGGGITGLTSAWYLAQAFPKAKITVFEASDKTGGWIQTSKVAQNGIKPFVAEHGPRSLRPLGIPGFAMLVLVHELGLTEHIVRPTGYSHNRFLYYPDHIALMPTPNRKLLWNIRNILSEPVFDGFLKGLFSEYSKPSRSPEVRDESIGSFVERRLGKNVANNIVSGVFHGIYAGDIWKLSAKSLFNGAWRTEQQHGSLTKGFIQNTLNPHRSESAVDWMAFADFFYRLSRLDDEGALELLSDNLSTTAISFNLGTDLLISRLNTKIAEIPNIELKLNAKVDKLVMNEGGSSIEISSQAKTNQFDHVFSTLQPRLLANMLHFETSNQYQRSLVDKALAPVVEHERPVTVGVVNVALPRTNSGQRPPGFGYLIPQSVPFEQNPECALGVVFDSDVFPNDVRSEHSMWSTEFSKKTDIDKGQDSDILTVMLGGHWWDSWDKPPDKEQLAENAKSVLRRHLGITQQPLWTDVIIQESCIPQYTVGHEDRLAQVHDMLVECFDSRLRVGGSGFTGVSINDCILSGWRSAEDLKADTSGILRPAERTGLERYKYGNPRVTLAGKGHNLRLTDAAEVYNSPHWFHGPNGLVQSILPSSATGSSNFNS